MFKRISTFAVALVLVFNFSFFTDWFVDKDETPNFPPVMMLYSDDPDIND